MSSSKQSLLGMEILLKDQCRWPCIVAFKQADFLASKSFTTILKSSDTTNTCAQRMVSEYICIFSLFVSGTPCTPTTIITLESNSNSITIKLASKPMADPGFPGGGGANPRRGRQHTILPNFPKNCMKLKEIPRPLLRSATVSFLFPEVDFLHTYIE